MTGRKCQMLSRLVTPLFLTPIFVAGLFLSLDSALADDRPGDPSLLIVPAFEHPAVSRYLPGAKRTVVTPAFVGKTGKITPVSEKSFATPEEWDAFVKEARERSLLQLATLDTTMMRDEHDVIQMAVITTETPVTASLILLPEFLQHFSAIFGPELLITIPAQNKICVFPKLANHLPQMAAAIRDDYLISVMPASTEIFELSHNGLRAVGSLNPDDD